MKILQKAMHSIFSKKVYQTVYWKKGSFYLFVYLIIYLHLYFKQEFIKLIKH